MNDGSNAGGSLDDDDDKSLPPSNEPSKDNEAKSVRGRQGDQTRPTCPQCSQPKKKPVLLRAASTPGLFTWYRCPTPGCSYSVKVPRPNITQLLGRQRESQGEDFSAR